MAETRARSETRLRQRLVGVRLDDHEQATAEALATARKQSVPAMLRAGMVALSIPARPFVSIDPAMRSGRPTVNGTRLQAEVVADYVWAGDGVDDTAKTMDLTRADVLVCCWYQGQYGTRPWRKRFGAWSIRVSGDLWHSRYDIPDPPSREEQR